MISNYAKNLLLVYWIKSLFLLVPGCCLFQCSKGNTPTTDKTKQKNRLGSIPPWISIPKWSMTFLFLTLQWLIVLAKTTKFKGSCMLYNFKREPCFLKLAGYRILTLKTSFKQKSPFDKKIYFKKMCVPLKCTCIKNNKLIPCVSIVSLTRVFTHFKNCKPVNICVITWCVHISLSVHCELYFLFIWVKLLSNSMSGTIIHSSGLWSLTHCQWDCQMATGFPDLCFCCFILHFAPVC